MSVTQLFLLVLVACLACGLGVALSMLFLAMIKDKPYISRERKS
jgi:hypothetical protein